MYERHFTEKIKQMAEDYGWEPFHVRDHTDYWKNVIGKGFPDFVMYRLDTEGTPQVIVAELKVGTRQASPEQQAWLNALESYVHVFLWRPSNWDEIEQILRHGPPARDGSTGTYLSPVIYTSETPPLVLDVIVSHISREIADEYFPSGDLAEMRRMNPDNPDAKIFWQYVARKRLPQDDERKWALILNGMALMTRTGAEAHNPKIPVGEALFNGGEEKRERGFYSDMRLKRLLTARGPMLRTLLMQLFRMMGTVRQSFNWCEMARFILNDEDTEEQAEKARRRIARAYYEAERRSSQSST